MKKKENKSISMHNYFIVIVVSILTIIVCLYARTFYISYKNSIVNQNVFIDNNVSTIKLDDLDYALNESSETILYVSYTGSREIYNAEKKLYRYMKRNDLLDKIVYLNVENNEDYLNILRKKYSNISSEINTLPMIIYIKDGQAVEAYSSELKIIDATILDKIIKEYEIE